MPCPGGQRGTRPGACVVKGNSVLLRGCTSVVRYFYFRISDLSRLGLLLCWGKQNDMEPTSDFEPKESWVRILCCPFLSCPGKKGHNMGQVGTATSSLSVTGVTKPALAHTSCPQCSFPNYCTWPVRGTGRPGSESWLYTFLLCDFWAKHFTSLRLPVWLYQEETTEPVEGSRA